MPNEEDKVRDEEDEMIKKMKKDERNEKKIRRRGEGMKKRNGE